MDMSPLRRTVLVMLLVAIPWFMIGVFSWTFLLHSHLESGVKDKFWMWVSIIAGGVMCILAFALFVDGVRKKQINPLLIIFALSGLWYLVEWPAKALLAILRP
jgi:hypothetical protein